MGRNAASVLPDAVAAAMITSCSACSRTGIAYSCASRRPVQPFCHTQRWMRSSSRPRLDASGAELETGKLIVFHRLLFGRAAVHFNFHSTDERSPICAGMLLEHGQ